MIIPRRADDRGRAALVWLDSRHTFSFGDYHDPAHMGFGPLRVINEDRVIAGAGFGTHGHRDMEIISYVLEGALEHKDSIGTGSVIRPGDVQVMSAGTGIRHSEYNHSQSAPVHFLQIWVIPARTGITPRYDQKTFSDDDKRAQLRLVLSGDGRDGSIVIHQDADIYASLLQQGQTVSQRIEPGRKGWVQVLRGGIEVNGQPLAAGDGASVDHESKLDITATGDATELLLFDLPPS
jgi:quercetin 2,3-dioxygenase